MLADTHGNVIVVGTRDCSLQRRYQKLVEEAPAPFLSDEQRATIHEAAKAICREAGYHGAGTVEFLVGQDGSISFLEVNTRLQVEHPVSEETSGLDLVREQFRIAEGEPLHLHRRPGAARALHRVPDQRRGRRARLPARARAPSRRSPSRPGPGVRVDAGVEAGSVIGGQFDSLLAKLIVTGSDRRQALERSRRALAEFQVEGMATVLPFHRAGRRRSGLRRDDDVHRPHPVDRDRVGQHRRAVRRRGRTPRRPRRGSPWSSRSAAGGWRCRCPATSRSAAGRPARRRRRAPPRKRHGKGAPQASGDAVTAPMQGTDREGRGRATATRSRPAT